MEPKVKKLVLAAIGSAIALSFAFFAILFVWYDRGGDPNNEDEILALAKQAVEEDNPPLAAECWRRLTMLNPFNKEYSRRYCHSLLRLRDFETFSAYTNSTSASVEFTEEEKQIEHLIAQGIELVAAGSNELAVACFMDATNLNYFAAAPYLIDAEARRGDIVAALDDAREYIKRFPRPAMVQHTMEWLALADRIDLIEDARRNLLSANRSFNSLVLDYYCAALIAWVQGDKDALFRALGKVGNNVVDTPVLKIMALESAADGNDPIRVAELFHDLFTFPPLFDFQERGRRAVKRFVAMHFPDKLPIAELGRLANLVLNNGGEDVEMRRVSLLARLVEGTLQDYMIAYAEQLYPDDKGIKAIREEYERALLEKQGRM